MIKKYNFQNIFEIDFISYLCKRIVVDFEMSYIFILVCRHSYELRVWKWFGHDARTFLRSSLNLKSWGNWIDKFMKKYEYSHNYITVKYKWYLSNSYFILTLLLCHKNWLKILFISPFLRYFFVWYILIDGAKILIFPIIFWIWRIYLLMNAVKI